MKYIELTKGEKAIVDDIDFEYLNKLNWSFSNGYAAKKLKGNKNLFMHTLIVNCPKNMKVDHKNGDGLDNRKKNLRVCTQAQNIANQKVRSDNLSGYKGVSFFKYGKRIRRWVAKITVNYSQKHLGYFYTEKEAAIAYNKGAKKYFGEFAKLNSL